MSHDGYPRLERSVMRSHFCRLALGQLVCVAFLLRAQSRTPDEGQREKWQRVPEIFAALGVRPGVTVADVGAGDGFFTIRLARAVGSNGRVFAVDVDDAAIERRWFCPCRFRPSVSISSARSCTKADASVALKTRVSKRR